MLKLSRQTDYGLMLLTALAKEQSKDYISLSQIAEKYKLPYKFLTRIATKLKSAQIVTSREGVAGGYRLSMAPQHITLAHVIQTLEKNIGLTDCVYGKSCPAKTVCHHQSVMQELSDKLMLSLSQKTIQDLVNSKR
jgi:Rrf2 family protein